MKSILAELVAEGSLESVPSDLAAARSMLEDAERHVDAARRIADLDPIGAYVLSYDAARKSIAALLLAEGLRTLAVPGAHAVMSRAALAFGSDEPTRRRLRQLDQLRRNRHRSEYGLRSFSEQETSAAIELAAWTVDFASNQVHEHR